jgi:WD40 repeat protein
LAFSKGNEFLAAGLADGYVKVWDLKKKEAKTFKPTNNYSIKQSVTSVSYSNSCDLLAAANNQGYINLYPMSHLS